MLDVRPFEALSFWIRGEVGGEALQVRLADERWERIGDALTIGPVSNFLPSGRVEAEWQQAVIPRSAIPPRLDRSLLARSNSDSMR